MHGSQPPRRMRYSVESRLRVVRLIEAGMAPAVAARASGASRASAYRWWYRDAGWQGVCDRSSVPRRQPRRLSREAELEILAARRYANAGPVIVAGLLGRPPSTVWKVLRRYGCSRLARRPAEPPRRYERARPGELVHVDIKRLGRFHTPGKRVFGDDVPRNRHAGWQYVHLAIDDHSRLAYAEILPSESPTDCARFLRRATSWYHDQGITVERVISDNGNGHRRLARHLHRAGHPAPLHAATQATDERQGRSPRQDPAAGMGLSLRLPNQQPQSQSAQRLPTLVQHPQTPRLTRRPTTNQPHLTRP